MEDTWPPSMTPACRWSSGSPRSMRCSPLSAARSRMIARRCSAWIDAAIDVLRLRQAEIGERLAELLSVTQRWNIDQGDQRCRTLTSEAALRERKHDLERADPRHRMKARRVSPSCRTSGSPSRTSCESGAVAARRAAFGGAEPSQYARTAPILAAPSDRKGSDDTMAASSVFGVDPQEARDDAMRTIEHYHPSSPDARGGAAAREGRPRRQATAPTNATYIAAVGDPTLPDRVREDAAPIRMTGHLRFSAEEVEAVRRVGQVEELRAMSVGTGSAGGFAVPFVLDPSIMLSSERRVESDA